MNKYQRSDTEYLRVTKIIGSGMSRPELSRFFVGLDAHHYLTAIGGNSSRLGEKQVVEEIFKLFIQKKIPQKPVVPNMPIPDTTSGIQCDGCTELDKIEPKNRRWFKVDEGQAITVSFDMEGAPQFPGVTSDQLKAMMINEIYKWLAINNSAIRIQIMDSGKGDIHNEFGYIDGPGQILGATWVSRGLDADMGADHEKVGDITLDNSERWITQGITRFLFVFRHEFGHALGSGHTDDRTDTMYFTPTLDNQIVIGKPSELWAIATYPSR